MQGRYWAIIDTSPTQTHLQSIEEWYYTYEDPTDSLGACASFELVHCVRADSSTAVSEFHLDQQNPYERTFYLFYCIQRDRIYILGGLHWTALKSRVNVETDLVRSRSFLPLFEFSIRKEEEEDPLRYFYLPCANVTLHNVEPRFVKDALHERVDYYLGLTPTLNIEHSAKDEWLAIRYAAYMERAIESLSYNIPGTALDATVMRERFHFDFLRCEWTRYMEQWGTFNVSERNVLKLLLFNGFFQEGDESGVKLIKTPPNPKDLQSFARRHPNCKPPTVMLEVDLVDVPQTTALLLPIYPRGVAHISYLDVQDWIWSRFIIDQQMRAFKTKLEVRPHLKWLDYDLHRIKQHYVFNGNELEHRSGNVFKKNKNENETRVIINASDEELLSFMPPCFERIMTQDRFMQNSQRLHWLNTLKFAGISRDTIAAYLERSNDAHPRGYKTAKARFDYDYAYNKRSGPTYCSNIVQNSDPNGITCPFAAQIPRASVKDIEDLVDRAQCQCAPGQRAFRGPAALIMRAIYRSGKVTAAAAPVMITPIAAAEEQAKEQEGYISPFDSSSSEADMKSDCDGL